MHAVAVSSGHPLSNAVRTDCLDRLDDDPSRVSNALSRTKARYGNATILLQEMAEQDAPQPLDEERERGNGLAEGRNRV